MTEFFIRKIERRGRKKRKSPSLGMAFLLKFFPNPTFPFFLSCANGETVSLQFQLPVNQIFFWDVATDIWVSLHKENFVFWPNAGFFFVFFMGSFLMLFRTCFAFRKPLPLLLLLLFFYKTPALLLVPFLTMRASAIQLD